MPTIIFGADGLIYRILHPLMKRGDLPNFQRLQQQGCEAILESKYPPLTPPAWMSLSTGLKPANHGVYNTTEVYGTGPYAPHEPHLIILPTDGITFRMSLGNKRFWDDASKMRGTHQKDGVLYAYGTGIKQGFKAPNAEIYDIVPTVLQSMGLPLPHTFDGRPLHELFVEKHQATSPIDNNTEGGLARRKLKKLLEI